MTARFEFQEGISDEPARQARRSMRSLSASSCSSLSSLETTSVSACSASSLMALPSGAQKKRRRRHADGEEKRRAKRQRANPRKRDRPQRRLARLAESKLSQARCQPVQTDLPFEELHRSKLGKRPVPDFETLRSDGFSVVPWDGM